jgi:hypothetical protein
LNGAVDSPSCLSRFRAPTPIDVPAKDISFYKVLSEALGTKQQI